MFVALGADEMRALIAAGELRLRLLGPDAHPDESASTRQAVEVLRSAHRAETGVEVCEWCEQVESPSKR